MSTKIPWTDKTWNIGIGCSKVSPACDHCYAEIMAARQCYMGNKDYMKVVDVRWSFADKKYKYKGWNGQTYFVESRIHEPLSWNKPKNIFVCSMGDLFHETMHDFWIDRIMAIMAVTPRHTYQVLTKRPDRMLEYFSRPKEELIAAWGEACYEIGVSDVDDDIDSAPCFIHNRCNGSTQRGKTGWPMTNLWLGVTAENQEQADKRIPLLLRTPANKRFVSIEPMLGDIDLNFYLPIMEPMGNNLDWVIVGGESGSGARPMQPDWVRSIRDQCISANVPFFFKQWGEWGIVQYPPDKNEYTVKVGKKASGHLLDGKEWRQRP